MQMLALLMKERGYHVSGSDLRKLDIEGLDRVYPQDGFSHLEDSIEVVVYNTDIPANHPDLLAAKQRGLKILHRVELQDILFQDRENIMITGSSGKTSTSYYVYSLLRYLKKDPFGFIGAFLPNEKTYYEGSGPYVFEFTESDLMYKHFPQDVLLLLNFSLDHYWNYSRDPKLAQELYIAEYRRCILNSNRIIYNKDDKILDQICNDHMNREKFLSYGYDERSDLRITNAIEHLKYIEFEINGIKFTSNLHGLYSVYNVTAAIAIAHYYYGIALEELVDGVKQLTHVHRRMLLLYQDDRITIIDDHATAIEEFTSLLNSVKKYNLPITIVYESPRLTRFECMEEEFWDILSNYPIAVRQREIFDRWKDKHFNISLLDSDEAIDEFFDRTSGLCLLCYFANKTRPYYLRWVQNRLSLKGQ